MDEPTREVFDNYQSNYERRGGKGYFKPLSEVKALHLGRIPRWLPRIPKTARILDAGCATGYLLGLLHELGYTQLTGVDVSSQLTQRPARACHGRWKFTAPTCTTICAPRPTAIST